MILLIVRKLLGFREVEKVEEGIDWGKGLIKNIMMKIIAKILKISPPNFPLLRQTKYIFIKLLSHSEKFIN